jgi:hypothetical protein
VLVADLKRRKFGATSRPRSQATSRPRSDRATTGESRTPSAAVRRAVSARDANRCAFVSRDGHRCGETRFLEFHHLVPYARGGPRDGGQHPASLSGSQRVRSRSVLRAREALGEGSSAYGNVGGYPFRDGCEAAPERVRPPLRGPRGTRWRTHSPTWQWMR